MLQGIIKLSVERRWLVVLVTVLAGGLGLYSLARLPIDAVPDITNNQVQVNTEYPSLSPVEIEKQVTFPIETALAGIPGLAYTRSISRNGFSQVTAVFEDSVDVYFARQQVTERLGEARESLPDGAEPRMGAVSTGLGEVYMWTVEFEHPGGRGANVEDGQPGWQSDGSYLTPEGDRLRTDVERAAYLRTIQDWIVRPQLKGVKDVAGIDAIGGYEKQYHVQPDPMKLVSYGLTLSDVIEALRRNNSSIGAGYIEHNGESYTVRATGRIERSEQIGEVLVTERSGVPVRVRDVAAIEIGRELRTGSASENGEEVVVGTALMLIGANSRTVAAEVDRKMAEIRRSLPADVRVKTVLNRTKLVDATIHTVQKNLIEGAALVIVVLFLMLGNFRAAFITALAIPLSMLLTATFMVRSRISGNLMSLGAIDFGLVVDGAVIIVENCLRRLAERQHALGRPLSVGERLAEVTAASSEMVRPSVFGQAIIIAVYLPVLTLAGVEGKMFFPMAATVIFALISAFILSLTFVPAAVAIALTRRVHEEENRFVRWCKARYLPVLGWSLRRRGTVIGAGVGAFAVSLLLFQTLGTEFVPTLDEKDIAMHAMRIPGTGVTQSTAMQLDVERAAAAIPEVGFVFSKTGTAEMASDPMPPNVSDTFIIFKPRSEWPAPGIPKWELVARIEQVVGKVPGNNYEFTQPIQMRFNELIAGIRSDVAVKVYGDQFEQLVPTAQAIAGLLQSIPGAADVKVEQTEGLPTLTVDIDRAAAARFGLNVADVQDVIAVAVGGREAGVVFEGDRRFPLVVRLPEHLRGNIGQLAELPIPTPVHSDEGGGKDPGRGFVPLGSIARIETAEGPNQISRENGKRRVVVQANVRGRDMGTFVAEAQRRVGAEVKLPAGVWLDWGGQFENLVSARQRLNLVVPACFAIIFLLLYSTFGSVRQALVVFSGVPLALTGGILSLWMRGMPFSLPAAIGFIALSGVAVLNGVVLVSFINQLRAGGASLADAVRAGAATRLRPVLMTALVAALGFVPMALATGTGAEVQKPLATVVIGGIITSTLLTLVLLPTLYELAETPKEGV